MGTFKPLTEEEVLASGLMEEGIYDFEVMVATHKTSGKGNEMYELNLNVFDSTGYPRSVRTWILPAMPKQWKHFHDAVGMLKEYQAGIISAEVAPTLVGKTGKLKLVIGAPYTNKDGLETRSNKVDDYIKRDGQATSSSTPASLDDEIPF